MARKDRLHLKWFRDQGHGQEAADAFEAEQVMDGSWPIARIVCEDVATADKVWESLFNLYEVNATLYHALVRAG